jgi:hypothetical protein
MQAANPGHGHRIWAITTTTGHHCIRIAGAAGEIEGRPVRFDCGQTGLLLGEPKSRTPFWTIYFAVNGSGRSPVKVGISDTWW